MIPESDPNWIPVIGEIAWLPDYWTNKTGLPGGILGHYALVLHVTPGTDPKTRHVWFLILCSTKTRNEEEKLYFQYGHMRKNGTPVNRHDAIACRPDCNEFIFLKPHEGKVPPMNKPGFIGLGEMFEATLDALREAGKNWFLRDCSFTLVTDKVRNLVADHVSRWKPHHEHQMLCRRISLPQGHSQSIICWVETPSKQLVDGNGTSYTGYGPCVLMSRNPEALTARIAVMLDDRESKQNSPRFVQLRADTQIVCAKVSTTSRMTVEEKLTMYYNKPTTLPSRRALSNQSLVIEPTFEVAFDDLYELPLCYIPPGIRVAPVREAAIDVFEPRYRECMTICARDREARDAEPNRIKAAREAGELKKARMLGAEVNARKARQQEAEGKQDHEELVLRTGSALKEIKDIVVNASTVLANGYSAQASEHVAGTVAWVETYLLMCTAMVHLQTKGSIPRHDAEAKAMSTDQQHRSKLTKAMDDIFTKSRESPPPSPDNTLLRQAIGPEASACNPFFYLINLSTWPTWEDIMPQIAADKETTKNSRSSPSRSTSSSDNYVTAPEALKKKPLPNIESAATFIGPVKPPAFSH